MDTDRIWNGSVSSNVISGGVRLDFTVVILVAMFLLYMYYITTTTTDMGKVIKFPSRPSRADKLIDEMMQSGQR